MKMDGNECDEIEGKQKECKDSEEFLPSSSLQSLMISQSESVSELSQALSPVRNQSVTTACGGYVSKRESFPKNSDAHVKERDEQDLRIHSAAVVKSTEVEFPVQFRELQSNTDLKMPPSNWLQEHSSIRLPNATLKHADFSSFLMAHQFPDCIGEVDVVSDAENIKKLLKIPYNPKAHVSMMIHRVGKTLLIDEFDIYKYLLRQSKKEWHWLRKFFFENVLQSLTQMENVLVRPNKSRNVVQSRSLLSKFLYHSINEEETRPHSPPPQPVTESPVSVRRPSVLASEIMPEPALEDQLPQSSGESFTRNVVWNFEDLHMLIGTDLPIFGGGTHPCVSLRLRDMSKPINILTGIDYWLDNLMCNVPEVVMCYHLDGIVQKYELIKTEDLPHMSDRQFSPRLVRDVAQNILAFLNSKATKEGHTYWLFKGKDDDIVKLYDLTSLSAEGRTCVDGNEEESSTEEAGNPFTIPVAMLFYRVAKNMRSSEDYQTKIATIRALLKNSLTLLNINEYPKIVSSAHYMLSDLYVPQDIDPDSPVLSDCSDEESDWTSGLESDDDEAADCDEDKLRWRRDSQSVATANPSSSIKVSSLCHPHISKSQSQYYKAPPLLGTLEERCLNALSHVTDALQCLRESRAREQEMSGAQRNKESPMCSSRSPEQQEPKMARPFQPIPMPYSPLNSGNTNKSLVVATEKTKADQLTVSVLSHQYCVASWWDKLSVLLLRKAALVYLVLARSTFNSKRYGQSLRYIRFSFHAWYCMTNLLRVEVEIPVPSQALALAGDAYYMLSKKWDEVSTHIEDYNNVTDIHQEMLNLLDNIKPVEETSNTIKFSCDVEEALTYSLQHFEKALHASNKQTYLHLSRRLASVRNELGVMYMNQAAKLCEEGKLSFEASKELWSKSSELLNRGKEGFAEVGDMANVALLHSNTGRLMRLCAFYCSPKEGPRIFSAIEKRYYNQALSQYEKGLEVLKSRKKSPDIWDLVVWEFSTTVYTIASLMQDHPPFPILAGSDLSREVVDMLSKALKHCDVKAAGARQPLYQYRAAVIHMRLASIYHNAVRSGESDVKNMRRLAELNYGKAAVLFLQLENPIDILKVQMDRAVLVEDQIQGTSSQQTLIKHHLAILHLLIDCSVALKICHVSTVSRGTSHTPDTKKHQDIDNTNSRAQHKTSGIFVENKHGENNNSEENLTSAIGKELDENISSEDSKNSDEMSVSLETSSGVEDEENHVKIRALLQAFEKKLNNSLMALVKIAASMKQKKSSNTGMDISLLKQMYSASLNTRSLPLATHLLEAVTFIAPILHRLQAQR
ncbi:Erythroid differentiation-related factor 1 [Halocaridina rubra]|uniref:Erythroid differentiation-related factor 1 n=1 Tax=Halocaridina rubra TaxID=373956 RepID=A0AAN8XLJ4_HALRR